MEPEESEYIQCNGSASHSTVPGLGDFVALRSESTSRDKKPSSSWNKLTTPSDIRLMHRQYIGNMSLVKLCFIVMVN